MTPAETPTECEHDCDCDMYHDGECYECLIDQKDARIRELVMALQNVGAQSANPSHHSIDIITGIVRAALARSEGEGK